MVTKKVKSEHTAEDSKRSLDPPSAGADVSKEGDPIVHFGPVPGLSTRVSQPVAAGAEAKVDVSKKGNPVVHFGPVPCLSTRASQPVAAAAEANEEGSKKVATVVQFRPVW